MSVVTPYYNTAEFLEEAIVSVLNQTFTDFEYILLDNCSTDGGAAIAERYARQDSRIRLEHNVAHLPEADANFSEGFRRIAPGVEYAKMVLADDVIFPHCLEAMVAAGDAHPSAGIISSYRLKGDEVMGQGLAWPLTFLDGRSTARRHLLEEIFLFGTQSTVMFRADIVRSTFPFFDPLVEHADTEACYRTLRDSDFAFVHQVLSFSRVRTRSVSGHVNDLYPQPLDKFVIVAKFGRDILSDAEYREVERRVRRRYFDMLGSAWLARRDARFWDYHRRWLASIGRSVPRLALWPHVLRAIAEVVLNPLNTLVGLRQRLTRW